MGPHFIFSSNYHMTNHICSLSHHSGYDCYKAEMRCSQLCAQMVSARGCQHMPTLQGLYI